MNKAFTTAKFYLSGRITLYDYIAKKDGNGNLKVGGGGKVTKGYLSSAKKAEFISRCIYMLQNKRNQFLKTFTLTYPEGYNTSNTKQHINSFLTWLKKPTKNHKGAQKFAYVAELTEKGTIHYHFICDCDYYKPSELCKAWERIRGTEYKEGVNVAVSGIGAVCKVKVKEGKMYNPFLAIKYFAKYISKANKVVRKSDGELIRKVGVSHELSRATVYVNIEAATLQINNAISALIQGMVIFQNEYVKMISVNEIRANYIFNIAKKVNFLLDNQLFEQIEQIKVY